MVNDLKNKNILVFGSGLSGLSAVKLLADIGAAPILYDSDAKKTINDIKVKLPPGLEVPIYTGALPPDEIVNSLKMVVVSPGISLETKAIKEFKARGIPLISEIELAYINTKGRIIAITGTNGKTTTVSLIGEIMKAHFPEVFIVGNIGRPFCEIALETTDETVIVLEVSSFQLETIKTFSPFISAILNITPDHLDRHGNMENYVAIKERIAENQDKDKTCILNLDNKYTADFRKRCPADILGFSATKELNNGCYLKSGTIFYCEDGSAEAIFNINETKLVGSANMENIMAALLAGIKMGISRETIITAIRNFRAVEHRLEYVATHNGVDYYNDSKATNPDAAIQGVRAMTKPTVLLAGGSDKKTDYTLWLLECKGKIKALILFGETRDEIAACAINVGFTNIYKTATMNEALTIGKKIVTPGDAILLSPACASFDMFKNYEERGRVFKELVL